MGQVNFLLDSNVLINVLNMKGNEAALFLRSSPISSFSISLVTWIEVLAGTLHNESSRTEQFLNNFSIIGVTSEIARRTVEVRKEMRIKLPDAIIYATALSTGRTLVTYNRRDFPAGTLSVHLLSLD